MRYFTFIFIFLTVPVFGNPIPLSLCNEVNEISYLECRALVKFYNHSPNHSWSLRIATQITPWGNNKQPCSWTGVICSSSTPSPSLPKDRGQVTPVRFVPRAISYQHTNMSSSTELRQVTGISLSEFILRGTIPDVSDLVHLTYLDLSYSRLNGELPTVEKLPFSLQTMNLSNNALSGELPDYSLLQNLQVLNLSHNKLAGELHVLEILKNLEQLNLSHNHFSGTLPQLQSKKIKFLKVGHNHLRGDFLPLLSLPKSLKELNIEHNFISIRAKRLDFSQWPNLEALDASHNRLQTEIKNLSLLKKLRQVDFEQNYLQGQLPSPAGFKSLTYFNFVDNQLQGELPPFTNALNLHVLKLDHNQLTGLLPKELADMSNLKVLSAANNNISGSIPSLKKLTNLQILRLPNNQLQGKLPDFSHLQHLIYLELQNNQLQGIFPKNLYKLQELRELNLSYNQLSGELPILIGLNNIENIQLSHNQFSGGLQSPYLNNLKNFNLSHNRLTGQIPSFKNMKSLQQLDLSYNQFSGTFPTKLPQKLEVLNLSHNPLSGIIPRLDSFSTLKSVYLRKNQFSELGKQNVLQPKIYLDKAFCTQKLIGDTLKDLPKGNLICDQMRLYDLAFTLIPQNNVLQISPGLKTKRLSIPNIFASQVPPKSPECSTHTPLSSDVKEKIIKLIAFPAIGTKKVINDKKLWIINFHGFIYKPTIIEDVVKAWKQVFGDKNNLPMPEQVIQNINLKQRLMPFISSLEKNTCKQATFHFRAGNRHIFRFSPIIHAYTSDRHNILLEDVPVIHSRLNNQLSTQKYFTLIRKQSDKPVLHKGYVLTEEQIGVITDIDSIFSTPEVDSSKLPGLEYGFLRPFQIAPEIVSLYQQWQKEDKTFHYVSGLPLQLYPAWESFLKENNLPLGAFHIETSFIIGKKLVDRLKKPHVYISNYIRTLLRNTPKRRYILLGRENGAIARIYAQLLHEHPNSIKHVYIFDTYGRDKKHPYYQSIFQGLADKSWSVTYIY